MVSEKKKKDFKTLTEELSKWSVIGIIDMHKLPGKQLLQIKQKLAGKAKIRMFKKRLILMALEKAGLNNIKALESSVTGTPAVLFSNENPFKLARVIEQSKSPAAAKEGDISPKDIVVPAGPTDIPPGPAIGDFQKAKIPAGVQDGKIAVLKDTTVAKEGEAIRKEVANMLSKLGIEPMEIGLNLVAAWENGTVYARDVLFVPQEKYIDDLTSAYTDALKLTLSTNYPTPDNIVLLVSRASGDARSLAVSAGIVTPETAGQVLEKANAEAEALKSRISK